MKRLVIGLVCIVMAAGACSLGEREEWADALHDAPETARRAKSANVFVSLEFEPLEIIGTVAPEPLLTHLVGEADFTKRSTHLVADAPRAADFFSFRLTTILPRSAASEGARKWTSIDFEEEPEEDIDVQDRRFSLGAPLIPATTAIDLLEGVLTGSIERVGREDVRGQSATRYTAKVSQDNAQREIDDEGIQEGTLRLLETMGVTDDVLPVDAWLDDQGRVVRVRLDLVQKQDRVNSFRTVIDYSFDNFGKAVNIVRPTGVQKTDDFEAFITDFIRESVTF